MKFVIGICCFIITCLLADQSSAEPEGWYIHYGFGGSPNVTYADETQDIMEDLESQISTSTTRLMSDLGFYFPTKSDSMVWGIASSGVSHTAVQANANEISIVSGVFGPSLIASTGSEPMIGLNFRIDLGFGAVIVEDSNNSRFTKDDEVPQSGLGGKVGIGFGFGLTEETRINLMASYSYIDVNKKNLGPVSYPGIILGFMF